MLEVILNLLKLRALSTSAEVYVGLFAVWLLMLAAGAGSVLSRPWSPVFKIMWLLVLLFLPVVGMGVYCLFSFLVADYSFLKVFGLGQKQPARGAPLRQAPRAETKT